MDFIHPYDWAMAIQTLKTYQFAIKERMKIGFNLSDLSKGLHSFRQI